MDQQQEIDRLKARIAELEQTLRDNDILHADELHRQRARVAKLLNAELARVQDVIVAVCERQPPKVHVAQAYLGDTVEALGQLVSDTVEGV